MCIPRLIAIIILSTVNLTAYILNLSKSISFIPYRTENLTLSISVLKINRSNLSTSKLCAQHTNTSWNERNRPKFACFISVFNCWMQWSKLQNMHDIVRISNLIFTNPFFVYAICHAFFHLFVYKLFFWFYILNVIFVLSTFQLMRLK